MADAKPKGVWTFTLLPELFLAGAVSLGILGALIPSVRGDESAATSTPPADSTPKAPAMARDVRVQAILEGYASLMDSVVYLADDAIFYLPLGPVYFQGGRMLAPAELPRAQEFDPIIYDYPLRPLTVPLPMADEPRYSRDFLEKAFGTTEEEIRSHGVSAEFLGRKVFVNEFCLDSLKAVEKEIQEAAATNPHVSAWVQDIKVAYSFIDKEIAGTRGRSHHAWGLAIDLVPNSYRGKQVYWRWSRVFNREDWDRIPMKERWSPPQVVIQAFENHGFVWGGKWSRFDTIHFEFRPEIVAYNRMMGEMLP